jgi:DNA (cytosine-5)-methyltransferase 1
MIKERLTAGSLFTGCGGMDLGFHQAGYDVRWICEIDKWCNRILSNRFPNTYNYVDVNELVENIIEPVDVLIGGFPCQPVSGAGRKDGVDDPRWLWPAFHRAIRHLRPAYVVVENVPGLFSRGFGDVLGALAVSGYNAEWFSLQSSDIGAPHRRKRVFILASDTSGFRRREISDKAFGNEGTSGWAEDDYFPYSSGESRFQAAANADTISRRFKKYQQEWKLQLLGENSEESTYSHSKRLERVAEKYGENKGLEIQRRDNIDGCNSVASDSDISGWKGKESEERRFLSSGGNRQTIADTDCEYDDRTGEGGERRWTESPDSYFGDYEGAIRLWENLFRPVPNPKDEKGRVSVELVEWMLGFPENWTEGVSRTQRLKMLGNSVQVQCAEVVANVLKEKIKNE